MNPPDPQGILEASGPVPARFAEDGGGAATPPDPVGEGRAGKPALHSAGGVSRRDALRGAFAAAGLSALAFEPAMQAAEPPRYERREASFDGTGKFYLGREIAHFMSHQGAAWLERPEREEEERPSKLIEALQLKPGMAVADIGAGTGYHAWRMANLVAPTGLVYAVDIQPEMLAILATNVAARGITNVTGVLGTVTDPRLPPAAVDLVLFVDVYHECDHPYEMLAAVTRALKPGGRLVLVEFREEDKWVPIKPLHKMSEAQVKKEMAVFPELEFVANLPGSPWQHILVFRRREG